VTFCARYCIQFFQNWKLPRLPLLGGWKECKVDLEKDEMRLLKIYICVNGRLAQLLPPLSIRKAINYLLGPDWRCWRSRSLKSLPLNLLPEIEYWDRDLWVWTTTPIAYEGMLLVNGLKNIFAFGFFLGVDSKGRVWLCVRCTGRYSMRFNAICLTVMVSPGKD